MDGVLKVNKSVGGQRMLVYRSINPEVKLNSSKLFGIFGHKKLNQLRWKLIAAKFWSDRHFERQSVDKTICIVNSQRSRRGKIIYPRTDLINMPQSSAIWRTIAAQSSGIQGHFLFSGYGFQKFRKKHK
jgi:hypothetical protein